MTARGVTAAAAALAVAMGLAGPWAGEARAQQPPQTQYRTTRHGFVRDWLLLGPIVYGKQPGDPLQARPVNYDKLARDGLTDPTWHDYVGGDWKIAPRAGEQAGAHAWTEWHADADVMDIHPDDYQLVYMTTYLWSPREMSDAVLYCGSDDFIEIFVNGRCVHVYKNERRGIGVDEVAGVSLRRGWNVITMKVVDVTYGYQAYLCVVDDAGAPLAEAPISLTPPAGLAFCSEQEALASKTAAHDRGQEKVPPETAYFSAAEAAGADYPVTVSFAHTARNAPGTRPNQPLALATAGDEPVRVTFAVGSTGEASARPLRLVAELIRRDQRAGGPDLLLDRVLDRRQVVADLSAGPFEGSAFTVPTDEIGYYALVVSLYDGSQRVRLEEHPFAVVSPPDYRPEDALSRPAGPDLAAENAARHAPPPVGWEPGDHARFVDVVDHQPQTRKAKFWPIVPYATSEITSPVKPNFLELGNAAHGGLGHITPTPLSAPDAVLTVRRDWLEHTRRYRFQVDRRLYRMDFYASAATQAVLAVTDFASLTVFEGLDATGLGQPSHVAYQGPDGVVVERLLDGRKTLRPHMTAPWLLFWFSGAENWKSVDIPVLVVLQHHPAVVLTGRRGVSLNFTGSAGAVAVMPLYGTRIITPADTAGWAAALPDDVAAECAFWSAAMRNYPRAGRDFFRLDGEDVQVRIDYDYVSTADDWGTPGVRFAPYPWWVALASEHPTSVVELSRRTRRTRQLHPFGPACGEVGDGSARYTLKDMARYVNEVRVVTDVRRDGKLARAYQDLEYVCGEKRYPILCSMTDLGGHNPRQFGGENFTYHRILLEHNGGWKFGQHCFENENSMICNLTHALAYLPPQTRQDLKALLMRFEDAGTLLHRWKAFNRDRLMFEDTLWFISRFLAGQWSYGHYTGHWQMIRDRWPLIRIEFDSIVKESSWGNLRSCGSEESNLLYQGAIGYARCAKAVGDEPEYRYGTFFATRLLALQQALWMTIDHDGHQAQCWYWSTNDRVAIDQADARPRRPARFYWWMMSRPIYQVTNNPRDWHATVISPFSYPYYPEIMRFHTERNEPFIRYYLSQWQEHFPRWYEGKTGGWGVYFGATEFFASRGWMADYLQESPEEMMDKYMLHHWGAVGPEKGNYEFNNRGWMSLPKALTAIIEASGRREWVRFY